MPATIVDYLEQYKEDPPLLERSLYLVLHDQHMLNADPPYKLIDTLRSKDTYRFRAVKLLDRESSDFRCVPAVALDRFFTLLDAMPESAGKQSYTLHQIIYNTCQ
jgi:hypothetical protein